MTILTFRGINFDEPLVDSFLFDDLPIQKKRMKKNRTVKNQLVADLLETKESYEMLVNLPGIDKKDVDISLEEQGLLRVQVAELKEEVQSQKSHWKERTSLSKAERSLKIPEDVEVSKIAAEHKNGLLHIRLPKKEKKVKHVQIQ